MVKTQEPFLSMVRSAYGLGYQEVEMDVALIHRDCGTDNAAAPSKLH